MLKTSGSPESDSSAPIKRRDSTPLLILFVGLAVAAAAVTTIVAVNNNAKNGDIGSASSLAGPSPTPQPSRTNFPTSVGDNTLPPTAFPSPFPTTSGPTSPTGQPTRADTTCTGDEICGCDAVVSKKLDILWFLDESGSIVGSDFNLAKQAIVDFVKLFHTNFSEVGENGTRHGLIKFGEDVDNRNNQRLDFQINPNLANTINRVNNLVQRNGGTDQKRALNFARKTFLQNAVNVAREGSQIVVIFLTDGNPCVTGGCPVTELEELNPVPALKELNSFLKNDPKFGLNVTFFYLPIGNNIKGDLFNSLNSDCCGCFQNPGTCSGNNVQNCQLHNQVSGGFISGPSDCIHDLVPGETFFTLNVADFSGLANVLLRDIENLIPLGPCIPAPSNRRRVLENAEAGSGSTTLKSLKGFE